MWLLTLLPALYTLKQRRFGKLYQVQDTFKDCIGCDMKYVLLLLLMSVHIVCSVVNSENV
jgi:hypothetical protein